MSSTTEYPFNIDDYKFIRLISCAPHYVIQDIKEFDVASLKTLARNDNIVSLQFLDHDSSWMFDMETSFYLANKTVKFYNRGTYTGMESILMVK